MAVPLARRSLGSRLVGILGLGLDNELVDERPSWDDTELRAWEARANELARCAEFVQRGGVARLDGCPLAVRDGERVFLVLRGTTLVERGGTSVDAGATTITNSRIVFHGATQSREWDFGDVIATPHDEAKAITYFELSSGEPTFGVAYPSGNAEAFRLRLTVALAWAEGDPGVVFPRLRAAIDAHMANRPSVSIDGL